MAIRNTKNKKTTKTKTKKKQPVVKTMISTLYIEYKGCSIIDNKSQKIKMILKFDGIRKGKTIYCSKDRMR